MADNNRVIVELGSVIQDRGEFNDLASNARLYLNNIVQYNKTTYRVKNVPAVGYLTKDVLPTNTTYYTVFAGVGELADSSDFTNPDATKRAKVPTVGAILDGLNDGIYDVSKRNPTSGPNSDGKFTLEYILSNANTLIPMSWRHGGMVISFVSTSDNKYVQYRFMISGSFTDAQFASIYNWQGVDEKPIVGSENLVESGGVKSDINDVNYLGQSAASLVGNWTVDGTNITFDGTGMNGTFTSHTAPNKPATSRPYFRFRDFEDGATYRLKLNVATSGNDTYKINFIYANSNSATWSTNKLYDVDGNNVRGNHFDCVFTAVVGKTYLAFSMDSFGINGTLTISDFSIEKVNEVASEIANVKSNITQINTNIGSLDSKIDNVESAANGKIDYINSFLDLKQKEELTITRTWYKTISSEGEAVSVSNYASNNTPILIEKGTTVLVYAYSASDYAVISAKNGNAFIPLVLGKGTSWQWYWYTFDRDTNVMFSGRTDTAQNNYIVYTIKAGIDKFISDISVKQIQNISDEVAMNTTLIPWDYSPIQKGKLESSVYTMESGAHKVFKVVPGEKYSIATLGNAMTLSFLKSYTIPYEARANTAEFSDITARVTVSVNKYKEGSIPSDANYMVITCNNGTADIKPKFLFLGSINCMNGILTEAEYNKKMVMSCWNSNGSNRLNSYFTLLKGKNYKISFTGANVQVDAAGNWLRISLLPTDVILPWVSAPSAGAVTLPSPIYVTPEYDSELQVIYSISEGSILYINVEEIAPALEKVKSEFKQFKEWCIEDMFFSGDVIDEDDDTNCYIQGHDFDDNGMCYVCGFTSKTVKGEGGTIDHRPVLITFNLANPIGTKHTYYMYNIGDRLFEDSDLTFDNCDMVTGKKINSNTVRVIAHTRYRCIYKDFNIQTNTFEQYGHICTLEVNSTTYDLVRANGLDLVTAIGAEHWGTVEWMAIPCNPILVDGYYYTVITLYGFSHVMCRSTNLGHWEVVSDVPLGYATDEVQLCYMNGRIYAAATGNYSRRTTEVGAGNATYDQVIYYDLTSQQWSQPITLEHYGYNYVAMAAMDGYIYSLHTVLDDNTATTAIFSPNYTDGYAIPRSPLDIIVFDQELNIVNKIRLNLRRPMVTSSFDVWHGNFYAFVGSNPKGLLNADGRQNCIFSYIDTRLLT